MVYIIGLAVLAYADRKSSREKSPSNSKNKSKNKNKSKRSDTMIPNFIS